MQDETFVEYPRPMQRELTVTPGQISHPEVVDGRRLWVDPAVKDITDMLQNGYPAAGWAGDPRLALFIGPKGEWVLNRLGDDGDYYTVARAKPGLPLDERLIHHLVAHDMRRKSAAEFHQEIERYNDRLQANRDQALHEVTAEALERVYWGASKDVGHMH